MARKRYSDEDCLRILRQVKLDLAGGADVAKACRTAGISDATYYIWRKKFNGMANAPVKPCPKKPSLSNTSQGSRNGPL
jgi:putative transposase